MKIPPTSSTPLDARRRSRAQSRGRVESLRNAHQNHPTPRMRTRTPPRARDADGTHRDGHHRASSSSSSTSPPPSRSRSRSPSRAVVAESRCATLFGAFRSSAHPSDCDDRRRVRSIDRARTRAKEGRSRGRRDVFDGVFFVAVRSGTGKG